MALKLEILGDKNTTGISSNNITQLPLSHPLRLHTCSGTSTNDYHKSQDFRFRGELPNASFCDTESLHPVNTIYGGSIQLIGSLQNMVTSSTFNRAD
ncbi:unnamed protein product [Allacma fusca]|uniref:Uncharacterized protein n=1 Tax=Allacma fusca TaxID=39272 RepID=A0A8J2KQA6_9HEXA|nr:unnamed protein product [Allacma fusca]